MVGGLDFGLLYTLVWGLSFCGMVYLVFQIGPWLDRTFNRMFPMPEEKSEEAVKREFAERVSSVGPRRD